MKLLSLAPPANAVGHTLLELMIAVVIVGGLVVSAVPGFQAQRFASARSSAQATLGAMMLTIAQQQAAGVNAELSLVDLPIDDDRYVYKLFPQPVIKNAHYWIAAMPRSESSLAGNGALTLTDSGLGCWHREQDSPVSPTCGLNDEVW